MGEMTREQRVSRVANGIVAIAQAVSDEPMELDADDKEGFKQMAVGIIKIWDGLNATEVESDQVRADGQ
jgi:hypothetical protein